MLGNGKALALRIAIASLAIAVVLVCLCMAFNPAWAAGSLEGDASEGGSVVQRDASDQKSDSSAASGSSKSSGESGSAQDGQTGGSVSTDASEESATQEESSPRPLDAEGNAINEGQVSDSSFLYDAAGEAVGEAIVPLGSSGEGSDQVRVTLYEAASGSSVTVCMTAADASKIKIYGAYGKTGATLRVQGTFNLTCKDHEGESDIHAESVVVVSQGSVHPDALNPEEFIPGAVALACGFVLMAVFWRIKERSR